MSDEEFFEFKTLKVLPNYEQTLQFDKVSEAYTRALMSGNDLRMKQDLQNLIHPVIVKADKRAKTLSIRASRVMGVQVGRLKQFGEAIMLEPLNAKMDGKTVAFAFDATKSSIAKSLAKLQIGDTLDITVVRALTQEIEGSSSCSSHTGWILVADSFTCKKK